MSTKKLTILLVSALAFSLAGCAGQQSSSSVATTGADTSSAAMKDQERKLAMMERELREKDRRLASMASELKDVKKMSGSAPAMPARSAGDSSLFPPNPRPGECYARVIIPAKYKTTTSTVVKREASERIEVVPAKYGPSTERILVKPASKRIIEVPAEYKTVTEKILDKPAHTIWKRGTGVGSGGGGVGYGGAAAQVDRYGNTKVLETRVDDTGEIMCLVEVPATYKTVTKQVLVRPASTREVEIPAEYKTVETLRLLTPPQERRIPIPEVTESLTSTQKITEEQIEWRPVLCEVNMTPANVSSLQSALQKAGCYRGSIDGVMGPQTLKAARCYANPKGLPTGDKYITIEVVRSLGLKF